MLLTMAQTLSKIWNNIKEYIALISLSGIFSCVFYCLFKFGFTKALNKIDTKKMKDEAISAAKNEVKETTFKVNIQPIVLSEVKKVCEEIKEDANTKLVESNKNINERLTKLENVVVALGNYFDDSIGVSENKKQAFHNAVDDLKEENVKPNIVVVEQLEVKPIETKEDKKVSKIETIER